MRLSVLGRRGCGGAFTAVKVIGASIVYLLAQEGGIKVGEVGLGKGLEEVGGRVGRHSNGQEEGRRGGQGGRRSGGSGERCEERRGDGEGVLAGAHGDLSRAGWRGPRGGGVQVGGGEV